MNKFHTKQQAETENISSSGTICILSDKIAAPHKKANRCRICSCSDLLFY